MLVCDRCLERKSSKIEILFDKEDSRKKSNRRRVLSVKMDLCEQCLTEFLHEFGKFKHKFMKDADTPDPKPKVTGTLGREEQKCDTCDGRGRLGVCKGLSHRQNCDCGGLGDKCPICQGSGKLAKIEKVTPGWKLCRCRHDETCGEEFESSHKEGEMTCCPECGKQQNPLVIG
jgi:hypothetical protein